MGEDVTLPPGFRFHPTDEELVSYYLRRKISGKSFNLNAIAEVDLYKTEPWDLPGKSCLKNRDLEWYFFSPLDKKYGIGARTNRATEQGYWKVTGKDREVRRKSKKLGLKKTLVFYQGRAPLGERTNWVMHEYRLVDNELGEAGIQHVKNSFVLCRVFKKSGSGPKTSEHYGAPLIEEEWDENVAPKSGQLPLSMFNHPAPSSSESPKMQSSDHGEKQPVSYGISPQDGLDPTSDRCIRRESAFLALEFDEHERCDYFETGGGSVEEQHNRPKFLNALKENTNLLELNQMWPTFEDGSYLEFKDLLNAADYPADETVGDHLEYFDGPPIHNPLIKDGSFLEMNDVLIPKEPEVSGFEMLDELLAFFDATDSNLNKVDFIPNHSDLAPQVLALGCQAFSNTHGAEDASSSEQKPEACHGSRDEDLNAKGACVKFETDVEYNKKRCWDDGTLSKLVGSIPAHPAAFATPEYPMKGAKSVAGTSCSSAGSIHITAATIHITGVTLTGGSGKGMSFSSVSLKSINIVSFGFSVIRDDGDLAMAAIDPLLVGRSSFGIVPLIESDVLGNGITMMWNGFYLFFLTVLSLTVSFKLGRYIYSRLTQL